MRRDHDSIVRGLCAQNAGGTLPRPSGVRRAWRAVSLRSVGLVPVSARALGSASAPRPPWLASFAGALHATDPRELSVHEQVSSPSKALRTARLVILTADLAIAAACLPPGAVQSGLFQGWTPAILSLIPSRQDECARSSAAKAPHTEASHTHRHHCRLAACPALWWPQGAKGGQRYYRHR